MTATLTAPSGERRFGWVGDIAADECTWVGTIHTDGPTVDGPLVVELSLTHEGATSTNRYETRVVTGHHEH